MVFIPTFRQPSGFDSFVLLASIALLRNWDKSCIDDLATASLKTLGTEIGFKHLEQLLNHACFTRPLSEELDGGGIQDVVHDAKFHDLLKGSPVIDLKFELFIAEVEMLLQNQHLDHDQWIDLLAPCVDLALFRINPFKQGLK